ncbi:MAG: glycosyltransferase family A protein [Planctomycetota bacterium]
MSTPRVSFVMCVRNAARHLREQLDSMFAQTFGDFEVVLFDDGSTDATRKITASYTDPRLRFEPRPAGNYVERLNQALQLARGEYIARVDGDDITDPNRLAAQVAFLDDHPGIVAVGSVMMEVDPYGVPLGLTDHATGHAKIEKRLLRGSGWAMPQPVTTLRKTAADAIGGYRPEMKWAEDLDFFLRLATIGDLANLPTPLVKYRRHLASNNSTKMDEQNRLKRIILADARRDRGMPTDDFELEPRTDPPAEKRLENWTWNALRNGRPDAARKHAWNRLKMRPAELLSWKLLACAVRGS